MMCTSVDLRPAYDENTMLENDFVPFFRFLVRAPRGRNYAFCAGPEGPELEG